MQFFVFRFLNFRNNILGILFYFCFQNGARERLYKMNGCKANVFNPAYFVHISHAAALKRTMQQPAKNVMLWLIDMTVGYKTNVYKTNVN